MTKLEPGAAPLGALIMDSKSDWTTMQRAAEVLAELGVPYESRIVSAHRTPGLLFEYVGNAEARGIQVIIAGAGGAAHLSGMAAAKTTLPVLGVPVQSKALQGLDHRQTLKEHPPAKFGLLARLSRGPKRSVGCYVSIGPQRKRSPNPKSAGVLARLRIPGMAGPFVASRLRNGSSRIVIPASTPAEVGPPSTGRRPAAWPCRRTRCRGGHFGFDLRVGEAAGGQPPEREPRPRSWLRLPRRPASS